MNIKKLKEFREILLVYMQLIRIKNCVIVFLGIFITATMVLGEIAISTNILFAAAAAFIITAAGNIFNDYYDYVIDKINRPDRPIPSGKVRRSDAMMLSLALFLVGIALAHNINNICFAIASVNVVILMIYARYSKKLLLVSNLIVSYLVASIFIFGSFAAAGIVEAKPILVLSSCAFLMTLSREIVKDIEDVKGDKESGSETLPIQIGVDKSKKITVIFSVFAVILSFTPYFFGLLENLIYYIILILIADIVFLYSLTEPASKSQKTMITGMIIAMAAFFAGSVF